MVNAPDSKPPSNNGSDRFEPARIIRLRQGRRGDSFPVIPEDEDLPMWDIPVDRLAVISPEALSLLGLSIVDSFNADSDDDIEAAEMVTPDQYLGPNQYMEPDPYVAASQYMEPEQNVEPEKEKERDAEDEFVDR